jgi:hypothetical protein
MAPEAHLAPAQEQANLAPGRRLHACVRGSSGKYPSRPCEVCKTIFTPKYENPEEPAKTCSPKCRAKRWRKIQRDNNAVARLSGEIEAIKSRLGLDAALNLDPRMKALEARMDVFEKRFRKLLKGAGR